MSSAIIDYAKAEDQPVPSNTTMALASESSTLPAPLTESPGPSDGGIQAWLYVLGSFLVFINIWGFTFAFGAFESYYSLHLLSSSSPSAIAWIGTMQSFLLIVIGVLSGPLFDLGYFTSMVLSGSFLTVLGIMMLSLSTTYYQIFLSQGICVGFGCGLLYVPSLALVGASFKTNRALAIGVVTCGIAVGGIVYTIAFSRLIPSIGFPWTIRTMGFIALALFLLSFPCLLVRKPASLSTSGGPRRLLDLAAFRDTSFNIFYTITFFTFLGYIVPYFYIPAFAQQGLHISQSLGQYALIVSQAASLVGRMGAAFAARRFGGIVTWIFCSCVSSILCFCWIAVNSTGSFFAFCALYGLFSAGLASLPATVLPSLCPDQKRLGTWMGMSWAFSGVAFLVGAPIGAALAKADAARPRDFLGIQVWSGVVLSVATALLVMLQIVVVKRKD